MKIKGISPEEEKLRTEMLKAAEGVDNILDVLAKICPGGSFVGKLMTVGEYVKILQKTAKRPITDATVRAMVRRGAIDGIYRSKSPNIKYLILLTERTKKYNPRTYKKKS